MTHLLPLAKEVDDDKVTPGVLGFIVFAVMAVAVWGLMKSMNKHMRKVDFKESEESGEPGEAGESTEPAKSTEPASSTGPGAKSQRG